MTGRKATLILFVTLQLLLAACAPGTAGGSATLALTAPIGEKIELEVGSDVYLRRPYALADFGLTSSRLQGAFWVPAGVNRESANLAGDYSFRPNELPPGWRLELVQIRAEREVETRYGDDTGRVFLDVVPVFHVAVPQDARLGERSIGGTIVGRDGGEVDVEFTIRVRARL